MDPAQKVSDVDIENSLEDVLEEHNEEIDASGDPKVALSIARRKLAKSVKTERSLRSRVRDLSEKATLAESLQIQLTEATSRLEKFEADRVTQTLESSLTDAGLPENFLPKALKLISDEDYDTVKGKKVFNAERFKEENSFLFQEEKTPVKESKVETDDSEEGTESDGESEDDGIEEQTTQEARPFFRQKGGSTSGKRASNMVKELVAARYTRPSFTTRE